jgi:hypothetical protein
VKGCNRRWCLLGMVPVQIIIDPSPAVVTSNHMWIITSFFKAFGPTRKSFEEGRFEILATDDVGMCVD